MTKYVNIDELVSPPPFGVVINGVKHDLKPATVKTFVENMKDIEALQFNSSVSTEIETSLRIIRRAFPTVPEELLMELEVEQLRAITNAALGINGEKVGVEQPGEAAAEGNAPLAS